MAKLYELTNEFQELLCALEQVQDDEELAVVELKIDAMTSKFEDKAISVAKFLLNLEAEAEMVLNLSLIHI